MINIDGTVLNEELLQRINEARGDLVYYAPTTCNKLIDFFINTGDGTDKEKLEFIREIRAIQDFITAFKLEE